MIDFTNRCVLITGATSGIGKEIAKQFVKQGAHVAIFGTNKERAEQTLDLLQTNKRDSSQKILAHLVDVGNTEEVRTAVDFVLKELGALDIVINNAGITKDGFLLRMSEEDWDKVIDTNLKSAYNICKAVIRTMMKAKGGKIINISSIVGITGNAGQVNYASSKAGLIGFTKALALEVASRGIHVNCIAPGYIQTAMTDVLGEEIKKGILDKIPLQRIGQPEDIASAALFLASSLSNYMTGQVLTVDGGMVM